MSEAVKKLRQLKQGGMKLVELAKITEVSIGYLGNIINYPDSVKPSKKLDRRIAERIDKFLNEETNGAK